MDETPWYLLEFPDFDRVLPDIAGFQDHSWHNDVCPRISRKDAANPDEQDLTLWCDFGDQEMREYPDAKLYLLQDTRNWDAPVDLCSSDNLDDIIEAIAAFDAAR